MKKMLIFLAGMTVQLVMGAVYQNSFVTDPIGNPLLVTTPELAKFLANPFQKDANAGGFQLTNASAVVINGAGSGHLILSETNSGGFVDMWHTGTNFYVNDVVTNSGGALNTNAFTLGNNVNGTLFRFIGTNSTVLLKEMQDASLSIGSSSNVFFDTNGNQTNAGTIKGSTVVAGGNVVAGGLFSGNLSGSVDAGASGTVRAGGGFNSDSSHGIIVPSANGSSGQALVFSSLSGNITTLAWGSAGASPTFDNTQFGSANSVTSIVTKAAITNAILQGTVALTPGGTVNVDLSQGNYFTLTAGQNFTLAKPTNGKDGQRWTLEVKQDSTGNRVLSLPANNDGYGLAHAGGQGITGVTLTTNANYVDFLTFVYRGVGNGTNYVLGQSLGY